MTNTLLILAVVALGATIAYARPGEGFGKHGKHHGGGGKHHGPSPPGALRFKTLFFVHNTFCYGLPLPNFTKPDGNVTRASPMMMPNRKPIVGGAMAFRKLIADASASDSDSSEADTQAASPKPNATVAAEEARLSRVVTRAAAAVVLAQGADGDSLCKTLVKAEQDWIDFRKANNITCNGKRGSHGPHGPNRPPMNNGSFNAPSMNSPRPPMFAAAVMPQNSMNVRQPSNNGVVNNQPPARFNNQGPQSRPAKRN